MHRPSYRLAQIGVFSLLVGTLVFAPGAFSQANVQGQWQTLPNTMPMNPVHAALMPNGKVLVVAGYYDLATPFNGIEHTVSHMSLEPPVRKNVSFTYYEAGHMMYIDKKSREKLHKDVVGFINSSYKP